jgi:hypothetical protein
LPAEAKRSVAIASMRAIAAWILNSGSMKRSIVAKSSNTLW